MCCSHLWAFTLYPTRVCHDLHHPIILVLSNYKSGALSYVFSHLTGVSEVSMSSDVYINNVTPVHHIQCPGWVHQSTPHHIQFFRIFFLPSLPHLCPNSMEFTTPLKYDDVTMGSNGLWLSHFTSLLYAWQKNIIRHSEVVSPDWIQTAAPLSACGTVTLSCNWEQNQRQIITKLSSGRWLEKQYY